MVEKNFFEFSFRKFMDKIYQFFFRTTSAKKASKRVLRAEPRRCKKHGKEISPEQVEIATTKINPFAKAASKPISKRQPDLAIPMNAVDERPEQKISPLETNEFIKIEKVEIASPVIPNEQIEQSIVAVEPIQQSAIVATIIDPLKPELLVKKSKPVAKKISKKLASEPVCAPKVTEVVAKPEAKPVTKKAKVAIKKEESLLTKVEKVTDVKDKPVSKPKVRSARTDASSKQVVPQEPVKELVSEREIEVLAAPAPKIKKTIKKPKTDKPAKKSYPRDETVEDIDTVLV